MHSRNRDNNNTTWLSTMYLICLRDSKKKKKKNSETKGIKMQQGGPQSNRKAWRSTKQQAQLIF